MGVSRVHHCIGQELIAIGFTNPPAKTCRCREFISNEEAQALVNQNAASWIIVERIKGLREETCGLCHGDETVKNCAMCRGKGVVLNEIEENIKSYDIVLVSSKPKDAKEKKYRYALALKTPRVPTIESKHIIRAYVLGVKGAQMRIEEYGELERKRLDNLIVLVSAEEYDKGERESWGRPIETFGANRQVQKEYMKIVKSRSKTDFGG
jgi:hypothetical protein